MSPRARFGLLVAAGYVAFLAHATVAGTCPLPVSATTSCQRVHALMTRRPALASPAPVAPMRADAAPVQVARL